MAAQLAALTMPRCHPGLEMPRVVFGVGQPAGVVLAHSRLLIRVVSEVRWHILPVWWCIWTPSV